MITADKKARAQSATPVTGVQNRSDGFELVGDGEFAEYITIGLISSTADQEFYVQARSDVLELSAEIARLERVVQAAKEWAHAQAIPFADGEPDREGEACCASLMGVLEKAEKSS